MNRLCNAVNDGFLQIINTSHKLKGSPKTGDGCNPSPCFRVSLGCSWSTVWF